MNSFLRLSWFAVAVAAQPGAAPISKKPGAALEKDYLALRLAWAQKHLLAPAKVRWESKSWAAVAEVFASNDIQAWVLGTRGERSLDSLADDERKDIGAEQHSGLAGLSGYRMPSGSKVTVRNVEVRLAK